MLIEPVSGWSQFEYSDDVVELIAQSMELVDNGGIWQYYNFTEDSSVWCSNETEATNQLQVTFDSNADDAKIKRLGIELTNNGSQYFKELFKLKKRLKIKFDIRDV